MAARVKIVTRPIPVDAEGDVQRRQHDQADHQQQGEKSRHHLLGEGEIVKAAQQFLHPVTSSFLAVAARQKQGCGASLPLQCRAPLPCCR